jgi:hypothetical protein
MVCGISLHQELQYHVAKQCVTCCRAMIVSLPGLMVIVTLSCFLGFVMFALYADCDPVKYGLISKTGQVCVKGQNLKMIVFWDSFFPPDSVFVSDNFS